MERYVLCNHTKDVYFFFRKFRNTEGIKVDVCVFANSQYL